MRNAFLIGKKIHLRGMEEADLENMYRWISDSVFTRLLFQGDKPPNFQHMKDEFNNSLKDNSEIVFSIVTKTDQHIGWAGIYEINWISRKGEIRFFIGEKKFWGKGYATETVSLLVDYAFNKLNLHRIYGGTNEENVGSINVFKNNKFMQEGVLKEEHFRNGKYYDVLRFGVINKKH